MPIWSRRWNLCHSPHQSLSRVRRKLQAARLSFLQWDGIPCLAHTIIRDMDIHEKEKHRKKSVKRLVSRSPNLVLNYLTA